MDLYARVNILGGRSVRLPHGQLDDAITLDNDPVARAQNWVTQGADYIHVVDLDAAAHRDYRNRELIDELVAKVSAPVQVAGGVRAEAEAERLIALGAWRVVMGTAAIEHQNMVWDLCRDYPDKIVVSLDVRPNEELATRGWTQNSGRYLEEVLLEMESAGVAAILVAEAGRDALMEPPTLRILETTLESVEVPVIASGGVRSLDDLRDLIDLEVRGHRLAGVVVGREVTHGRFTLQQAKATIAAGPRETPAPRPAAKPAVPPLVKETADKFRRLAEELETAASHARTAALRYLEGEQARGAAHGFGVSGHLEKAGDMLSDIARLHTDRTTPE